MRLRKRSGKEITRAHQSSPTTETGLDLINFHVAIFAIFLSLTFAYFVYFSYQLTEIQSEMVSQIYGINSINVPYPLQFLSIAGHQKYYYIERRDALRQEFNSLEQRLQDPRLTDPELAQVGKDLQRVITQIAYFFPYKGMVEFNQDGSAVFDPNKQESIDISKPIDRNFLKQQVDEIYNWNYSFTLKLKDSEERLPQAMILANDLKDEYTKSRVTKYLDSLIAYLEKHYELAIPLGLTLKRYDYISAKLGVWDLVFFTTLLIINFVSGVLLPMFWNIERRWKLVELVFQGSFILGSILLFKEALYSISL